MKTGPSEHLTWEELRCKDGTAYPLRFRIDGRAALLGEAFEALRAKAGGKPITVISGYRTPSHNAATPGSASASQHIEGRAVDIRPPKGWSVARLAEAARAIPSIMGLGIYANSLHIDVRPTKRRAVWHGKKS
ncbi:MAG: YcbK family protein [Thermoplasmatota archaeon]